MRESRTYGSVRGARGNSRPYRKPCNLLHLLTAAFGTSLLRMYAAACPQLAKADAASQVHSLVA
jgi:hypothetical protein